MTAPQIPFPGDEPQRRRWFVIAGCAWLLFVSVLAIINSVGLSRLAEQSRSSAQDTHLQALTARVGDLEQQIEAIMRQPKPIAQADLDAVRQVLEERLAQTEQAQAADDHADEVQALQARIGAIEARLKRAAPAVAAAPRRAPEPAKPQTPVPPFNVIGLELRGGERFLSVAAPGAASVVDISLLRVGDAAGAWHLQAIEARAAVFGVDGQTVRIPLP